jgi:S-formylglutathione hydrolase FrmB
MRILVDEVPRWVGTPVAALGISMGAFGALRLARKRHDLRACAALSSALFLSWGDAQARHAFAGEAEWGR